MASPAQELQPRADIPLLVLGLSRTGGTSLSRALARLGYENLYDLDDIANGSLEQSNFWIRAIERKLDDRDGFDKGQIESLLEGYDGVRNLPCAAFAYEFIRCYPTSKVILPTRSVESWHHSCLATVYARSCDPILRILALVDTRSHVYAKLLRGLQRLLYSDDFVQHGKDVFLEHNDLIRRQVPPKQLIEYRVQQGWGPLCEFLGKDVPLEPFPRSNDSDAFWKGCRKRDFRAAISVVTRLFIVVGILAAVGSLWVGRP